MSSLVPITLKISHPHHDRQCIFKFKKNALGELNTASKRSYMQSYCSVAKLQCEQKILFHKLQPHMVELEDQRSENLKLISLSHGGRTTTTSTVILKGREAYFKKIFCYG